MLEEVKKILEHGRAGVKVNGNGVAIFVMYPVSVEEMAKQICQLFEPKKKILGRKETLRLIHDTEEELFGMTESKPKTDYNIGDKGMTTGNESYGTLPKPAGRDASDWGLFTEPKPKSKLLTRKDLQDKFPGAYLAIDGVWYYANENSEYVPIPKQVKKPESRLLTGEDDVFIKEITKRCCGSPWGTVHAEVQYTALHFQTKTASIYEEHIAHLIDDVINLEKELKEKDAEIEKRDTRIKELHDTCTQWQRLSGDAQAECQKQLADCIFMQKAKCQARVKGIFKEIESSFIGSTWGTNTIKMDIDWQALRDKYIKKQEGVK